MQQKPSFTHEESHRLYRRKVLLARLRILSLAALLLAVAVGCVFGFHYLFQKTATEAAAGIGSPASDAAATSASEPAPAVEVHTDFSQWNQTCPWTLMIVNVDNPVPSGYHVITEMYSGTMEVDQRIFTPLSEMIQAAHRDGISLWISSAYRSNQLQTHLFEAEVSSCLEGGLSAQSAREKAAKAVAVPGTSEHETGLSVDLNDVSEEFQETQAYRWLQLNAAQYGFVQRYPVDKQTITGIIYEPWHYRYVGPAAASQMTADKLCLEEYIEKLIAGELEIPQ